MNKTNVGQVAVIKNPYSLQLEYINLEDITLLDGSNVAQKLAEFEALQSKCDNLSNQFDKLKESTIELAKAIQAIQTQTTILKEEVL